MKSPYWISPAAEQDLDEQADHLSRNAGLETAFRFYDAVYATLENIARLPGLGEQRETRNPRLTGLRIRPVETFQKHLIFYRPTEAGIEIVRILHGARDFDDVLH